ncbi:hypothetical protein PVAND_016169 [Polypedilum vanderplanki]|uniref:Uncharacterized protein n=1 Tax=Polypedilum vanderplanki TaxID=319348 RepID=A0A9J6BEN6_POLVA|nr:hypothetical protein PVAND_016169 [Polypedilum vanderplanki]
MLTKIFFLFSISAFFSSISSQVYTAQSIDLQLQQIHDGLIAEEANIEKQILNFISYITATVKDLKTQNKTMTQVQQRSMLDLFAILNTYVSLLTDLSTLDNYWPYNNIKSCSDANRKVTEIDFDIRQYWQLIGSVNSNITKLAQQYNWIAYYYTMAFSTLVTCYNGLQQQQQVVGILTTTSSIFTEYYNYIGQLARAINNETIIGVYLNLYKRQYCICGSNVNSNSGSNLSTLESNIQFIENPLVDLQTAILKIANEALTNSQVVSAALIASSTPLLSNNVDKTKTFLTNLVTMSDYSNITWNAVTACSDLYLRIGFVNYKYYQYLQTLTACNTNMTWTFIHQANLNATAVVYKLTNDQLIKTRNLISSMLKLEPLMQNYSSQLSYSVTKMWKILVDIKVYGDSYCGCRDISESTIKNSMTTVSISNKPSTITSNILSTADSTSTIKSITTSTYLSTALPTTLSTFTPSTIQSTSSISSTLSSISMISSTTTKPSTKTSTTITSTTPTTTSLSTTLSTVPTTVTSTNTLPATSTSTTTSTSTSTSTASTSTTLTTTPTTTTSLTTSTTTSTSTTASTSTSTPTTTKMKTLSPCNATFVNYNPTRNPLMPKNQGIPSAGIYFDGTAIYPGYSFTTECVNQDIIPARLSTVKSSVGAVGAWMACGGDIFNGQNASFIKANANIKWVPSNIDNLNSVVGAILVRRSYYSYYIGRLNLTTSNGTVYQQVSKIHIDKGASGLWYSKEDGTENFTNYDYEVLVCNFYV